MSTAIILIIAILVCYGITNIIVNGTIFEGLKGYMSRRSSDLQDSLTFNFEEDGVPDIRYFNDKKWAKRTLDTIDKCQDKLKEDLSDEDEEKYSNLLRTQTIFIKQQFALEEKRKKRKIFVFDKILQLTNCMMCMGFWIGVLLTTITCIFTINLFGVPIVLVSGNYAIGMFLLGCMFSGTSWFIGVISTYFGDGSTPSAVIHNYNHED
jgi:hypothetical protein